MTMSKTALSRALAILVLASLATACGGGDQKAAKDDAATAAAPAGKVKKKAGPAPGAEDDGMANAVAVGKTAAAVDLKYDLTTKPALGQPFEVDLAFLPRVTAESLEVEASGMTGLVLASGGTSKFDNVVPGERYVSKLLVQADQPGLYYISVTAKMVSKIQTEARTFSVPVVVGTTPPEEKPAAAAAAPGETVKSMPAVETATPKK